MARQRAKKLCIFNDKLLLARIKLSMHCAARRKPHSPATHAVYLHWPALGSKRGLTAITQRLDEAQKGTASSHGGKSISEDLIKELGEYGVRHSATVLKCSLFGSRSLPASSPTPSSLDPQCWIATGHGTPSRGHGACYSSSTMAVSSSRRRSRSSSSSSFGQEELASPSEVGSAYAAHDKEERETSLETLESTHHCETCWAFLTRFMRVRETCPLAEKIREELKTGEGRETADAREMCGREAMSEVGDLDKSSSTAPEDLSDRDEEEGGDGNAEGDAEDEDDDIVAQAARAEANKDLGPRFGLNYLYQEEK